MTIIALQISHLRYDPHHPRDGDPGGGPRSRRGRPHDRPAGQAQRGGSLPPEEADGSGLPAVQAEEHQGPAGPNSPYRGLE